jgi:hypothetical protein
MDKINLLINISEIAIITGHNKYKSHRDYLIDVWKKNNKKDYEKYIEITRFSKETDEIKIKNISSKNNIDIEKELKKCAGTKNINDLNLLKNKIFEKIENLSENDKKEITKSINNVTNTKFGIKNEFDVCKVYESMTNSKILKDNKYKIKNIFENENFSLKIGGKIDGVNLNNGAIIEIKNRMHKLFFTLRDYEKIQIMAYLFLHDAKEGHLVEAFKNRDGVEINIIDVIYDENYMNYIIEKINEFALFYFNFINDHNSKINLLQNEDEINF